MSNQLLLLDSNIVMNNVVGSTGVDLQAHEISVHEIVLDMDQNGYFHSAG